jgi:hypothetical protein
MQQIGIRRECGNDCVRLKALKQAREMLFEHRKTLEIPIKIPLSIQPPINVTPRSWPTIYHFQIGLAGELIKTAIGLGEEIVQLNFGVGGDLFQSVANAAGGGVVAFPKTDTEQQDFFHDSLGNCPSKRNPEYFRGEFTCESVRSLMDICVRQSKLYRR